MQSFDSVKLSDNITLINRFNKNTPRTSINIFINGGNRKEEKIGASDLTNRLLLKGTKNRTAEEIAIETDTNAIDLDIDLKQDYARIKTVFLNEDIDKTVNILSDLIQNSTFEQFEKEMVLFVGELQLDLDSPKAKATDNLYKGMYPEHPYGVVSSVLLENISKLTFEDITNYYKNTFKKPNFVISVVGDHKQEAIIPRIERIVKPLSDENDNEKKLEVPSLTKNKLLTITKEDAAQAQVLRGWYGPIINSKDFVPFSLLNNILGSSGLTSRLFIELRDKKGLAYSVRSALESLKYASNFTVYIGTEPKNINTVLKGFDEEIRRLIDEPVKPEELESAKKNILGKRSIYHETNFQQSYYLGLYEILGVGAAFDNEIVELIKDTTSEDILKVAQKYLTKNHITSILAPSKYLKEVNYD